MTYEKITPFEEFCNKYGNLYAGLFCVFASWVWIGGLFGVILMLINNVNTKNECNLYMGSCIALSLVVHVIVGLILLYGYERYRYKYTHNEQLKNDAQLNLFRDFGICEEKEKKNRQY